MDGKMASNDIVITVSYLARSSGNEISDYLFVTTNKYYVFSASHFRGASSNFDIKLLGTNIGISLNV